MDDAKNDGGASHFAKGDLVQVAGRDGAAAKWFQILCVDGGKVELQRIEWCGTPRNGRRFFTAGEETFVPK